MKSTKIVVSTIVGLLVLSGTAESRSLSSMQWEGPSNGTPSSGTGTSATLDALSSPILLADGTSLSGINLSFAPGTSATSYSILTNDNPNSGVAYLWGAFDVNGNQTGDAVVLFNNSSTLTVDFDYASTKGCSAASITVGSAMYSAVNPCALSDAKTELVFNTINGSLQNSSSYLNGGGWTEKSVTASAPEIDPASAMSGLTLLIGALAVLRGRNGRNPSCVAAA
jgi:hypothetical protein